MRSETISSRRAVVRDRHSGRRGVRRARKSTIVALAAVACLESVAAAQPAHLDPAFGNHGRVATRIGSRLCNCARGDYVTALLRLSGGKVLAAGSSRGDIALAMYDRRGRLDRSFGNDGKLSLHPAGPKNQRLEAVGLVRQRDGKFLVAAEDYFIARLKPNGTLDKTFSGDGVRYIFFRYGLIDIALQRNGRIVGVGLTSPYGSGKYAPEFFRLMPNGALDKTFGRNGSLVVHARRGFTTIERLRLQPDGKIVAVGDGFNHRGDQHFYIVRLLHSGRRDRSFGQRGVVVTTVLVSSFATDVDFSPTGKIIVGGYSYTWNRKKGSVGKEFFVVARYLPSGARDRSFGHDGVVLTRGHDAFGAALAAVGHRVYLAGGGPRARFNLLRYQANGRLDPSFGRRGRVETRFGRFSGASAMLIQPGGRVLLGGYSKVGKTPSKFALIRYLTKR
jgi:uncharacterized delta-60 repeat protein